MRAKFTKLFLIPLLLVAAFEARAQTLEVAMEQYRAGNFDAARTQWQALAAGGNPDAAFNLGQMYRLGQGISFNFPEAERYYVLAANAGHTAAQRELGNLYFFSIGTPEAQNQAIPWWQRAAANGDAKAQYILGILNFNGDVVAKDRVRGYAWTLLAMDGGVPEALQSNTAMRGQLTEGELSEALALAPALMTGSPNQGLYSNLIGEPLPRPRTIINGIKTVEAEPAPEPVPFELPERQVIVEPEVMEPLTENTTQNTEPLEAADPEIEEVQDTLEEVVEEAPAPVTNDADPVLADPEPEGPPVLDPEDQYDLGDPASGLIDEEGFDGAWSVQLTSFRKPENAEAHWQEVSASYPEIFDLVAKKILRFDLGEERGIYYRLRVGPFLDREEAEAKCQQIKDAGLDCLVIWP